MRTSIHGALLSGLLAALLAAGVAAEEEKVVNVYNWADYVGPTTLADFEAETGIEVNYDTYESSEMVEAKLLAGSTGYDVIVHGGQYSSRLIPIGVFMPLERERLTNWDLIDPRILARLADYDPGNLHAVPYMWGSTGFAYNVEMVHERMPDAPVRSGDMVFDPEVVSRLADCGVSFLDSPTDVMPMAMVYLGRNPDSIDPADLAAAEALIKSVRPYVKYFSSARMLQDLPNREICVAMSWSGDYAQAHARSVEAGKEVELAYTVPSEGSIFWFDGLLIPSDAPHPDNAHRFIDFLLRPDVIAKITNETRYANAIPASNPLVKPEVLSDPAVYPTPDVLARLRMTRTLPPKSERLRTRAWAHAKTGM